MGASMQLFAGLSGANTMGNFGRQERIDSNEVNDIMGSLSDRVYKKQMYDGPGGVKEDANRKMRNFLITQAEKGPAGRKVLEDLGYGHLATGADGKLSDSAKNVISGLDFFGDNSRSSPEVISGRSAEMSAGLSDLQTKLGGTSLDTSALSEADKAIAESLKDRLEKQLKSYKAATKEEIDKAFKSGDTSQIAALVARYNTDGEVDQKDDTFSSDFGRKIRNQINARQITSADIAQDLAELAKAKDGSPDQTIGENRIKQRLKTDLHMSDEEIQKYVDKDTGKLDQSKIRDFAKSLPKLTPDEQIYMDAMDAKEKGGRYAGFNFANTRGFKLEDFTSAFVRGADLRMLGDNRNMPPAVTMGNFAEHGAGALSAARSLIGNRSGDELMSFINDFAGKSKVDLSSEKGAGEMEDLLRKTKATARVAGVGINTMLEIIKATKELSANNPQLQYMSSMANTEMALKAVSTAAAVGGQMTAEEYRAAGGAKGIATRDITEKQAYAQSDLGGAKAAWLYNAKSMGPEKYKQVSEILGRVQSGRDLEQFGYKELSNAMGVSVDRLTTMGNNQLMRQYAMADDDIGKQIYNMADQDVVKSFFQGAKNYSGMDQKQTEAMFKQHVAAGGNLKTFEPVMLRYLSKEGQTLYNSQRGTIQRSLLNSLRGEDGRKRIEGMVNAQAALEKDIDKEFAGSQAPIVTQLTHAVMSGKDLGSKETAEAVAHIFATKDKDSAFVKNIMKNAQDAGQAITNMSVVATSDDDMLKRGLSGEVNKITEARREQMLRANDTEGLKKLRAVSDDDLKSLSAVKGIKEASPAKLKRMLADLRDQKEKGQLSGGQNTRLLQALETMEKTGTIDSANAISMIQKGDLKGFGAATLQATADYDIERYKSRKKDAITEGMGKMLTENSKLGSVGGEIRDAMGQKEYQLEGGKVNWSKMMDDFSHRKKGGSSYFDKMTDEQYKKAADSALGSQFSQTKDLINQVDTLASPSEVAAKSFDDVAKSVDANTESVKQLTEAINKGGPLVEMLSQLATALNQ
jgi:hypothetical protein